ncbi:MAG: hypothetical protein IPK82_44520 [Polyangiaceae bacterium]|nr:hypothetical protein [Polyangiaceae bacterium]
MKIRVLSLIAVGLLALAGCEDESGSGTTTTSTTTTSGTGGSTGGTGGSTGGSGGSGATGATGGSGGLACPINSDAEYDGTSFDTNAAEVLAIRSQAGALNSAMSAAEADLTVKPTLAELTALYEAGSPSVKSLTNPYYGEKILASLTAFEAAAGNEWKPAATPSGPGGKYGSYIFTSTGVDLRQAVDKGLFGSLFYLYMANLTNTTIDAAALDGLLAAFGAHPTFPGDSSAMTNPDKLFAQYAERRSPKDPNDASKPMDPQNPGPYFRIKNHFVRAQQAIKAGAACDTVRDEAIQAILSESERVIFSTVIFYLNDAAVKLTKEGATDAELAGGLHGYGETIAFIHGFRMLPQDARTITDAQIDELLTQINAPVDGDVSAHLFLTDGATHVPKLLSAISKVAEIYGWDAQDIESFKTAY